MGGGLQKRGGTRRPLSTGILSAKNVTHQHGFEPTTSCLSENDESGGLNEVCVVVIVGGPMVAVAPDSEWPARVCHHPLPPDPGQHPLEPCIQPSRGAEREPVTDRNGNTRQFAKEDTRVVKNPMTIQQICQRGRGL